MRGRKTTPVILILTASILLSCGAKRHGSSAMSHEQSQHRSELAVRDAAQLSRDSTLDEWELLLLDTIMPQLSETNLSSGESRLGVRWRKKTAIRYRHARQRVVQQRDSIALMQQQSHRQQEVVTKQKTLSRIVCGIIIGSLFLITVATLVWRIRVEGKVSRSNLIRWTV